MDNNLSFTVQSIYSNSSLILLVDLMKRLFSVDLVFSNVHTFLYSFIYLSCVKDQERVC